MCGGDMTTIILIVAAFMCGSYAMGGALEVFRHVMGQAHAVEGWTTVAVVSAGALSAILVTAIRLPREK